MAHALLALMLLAWTAIAAALNVQIDIGSIEHPALAAPITKLHFACRISASSEAASCSQGVLHADLQKRPLDAQFAGRLSRNGDWRVQGKASARGITFATESGRYATEKLDLEISGQLARKAQTFTAELHAALPRGQAYVEPVFVDFGPAPATLAANLRFDSAQGALDVDHFEMQQQGVLRMSGKVRQTSGAPPAVTALIEDAQLAPVFVTYLQPFLAGTRLEKLSLSGSARGRIETEGAAPRRIALRFDGAAIESESYDAGLRGLQGSLNWQARGDGAASQLNWTGGHLANLELGPAQMQFRTAARDLELLTPLRLPMAGGALKIHELALQRSGQPDMAARFDAEIEPLDLSALCRAFGWPEFGGQLGGRLPGLALKDGELKLDGTLSANAFDGQIAVAGLRVLDPFGRVPRVAADIRLRNLDLTALTGAFSFGRIDGRIDGDVQDLRLLNWRPISFKARLATPPGDKSRHRISQRAIDNISSIGGGPTGVLSRGFMRFFDDFAYARIGWSCVLANGVCRMDGIEPAKDGGYVLVKGRLLPRIDVVGYNRDVDWNTFVSQLQSARQAQGIEVR